MTKVGSLKLQRPAKLDFSSGAVFPVATSIINFWMSHLAMSAISILPKMGLQDGAVASDLRQSWGQVIVTD